MLRWLTAGESHGPALVAILEGLPAGVRVTSGDIAEELRRRRLGHGRGARMKFEQDRGRRSSAGSGTGRTLGGPIAIEVGNTEWPKWETVMSADPVDPTCSPPRRATRRCRGRGPATPTWSACRSTASTTPGRSSSAPARARPPPASRSARSPRRSCARRSAWSPQPRRRARRGRAPPRACSPSPATSRASTTTPCAASTPRRAPRWSRTSTQLKKAGDTLGGVVEVARLRPAAGPRQPRPLGPAARLPARRRPHGHPGDQGRRGRRRLHAPRARPGLARPTTRSTTRPTASGGGPTAPAASRAA